LLVSGCVRSGTTVLQQILNSHPDVGLTNELQSCLGLGQRMTLAHLRWVMRRGLRRRNHEHVFSQDETGAFRTANVRSTLRLLGRMGRGWHRQITPAVVRDAYRAVYPEARIVGDKSPTYVFRLDQLLRDGVRCLVIYRDCRDVVVSARRAAQTFWRGMPHVRHFDTVAKIAQRWTTEVEMMERHRGGLLALQYEALVERPGPELKRIAHWLDIDPGGLPVELVQRASVGRHASELSDDDRARIRSIAGPAMSRLGYS